MKDIISQFLANVPVQFFVAVIVTVLLTELSKDSCSKLEEFIKVKKDKDIKILSHTKIIFAVIFSGLTCMSLILIGTYTWKEFPLYASAILGVSVTCYEMILKKFRSEG